MTIANNQPNINQHSKKQFQAVLKHGLKNGGIHLTASKGHGKTRMLFCMAKALSDLKTCRVVAFDGSEAWLYRFSRIPVLTIGERQITLADNVTTTQDIERYSLKNWQIVKLALAENKDLLFRLKTRKPSKRGYFIRTVVNYLDALQRDQRAHTKNNEPLSYIAYFIEEAQDAFNSRSTTRLEAEEFLTVFNEARNQREAFFTASQRLNDFSKTIRTKQSYLIGNINAEDKTTFLRRLEKKYTVNFSELKQRNWFFNGSTFVSPTWKQNGKPFQINRKLRREFQSTQPQKPEQPKLPFWLRILTKINGYRDTTKEEVYSTQNSNTAPQLNLKDDLDNTLDEDLLLWEED